MMIGSTASATSPTVVLANRFAAKSPTWLSGQG